MSETKQLILCGDYEGDLEAIAKVLNGGRRFVVHRGRIQLDRFDIWTAFPRRGWCKSEDGRRLPTNEVDELSNESVDRDFDDYEELRLAEISEAIAPLLTRGTLELGSGWECKTGAIHFQKLSIRSDGWVEHRNTWVPREARKYYGFEDSRLR